MSAGPTALPTGRVRAVITQLEAGYAFALDDWGTRYFIFHNACQQTGHYGFSDLVRGSIVRLTPIEHPNGPRGIEVEVVEI